MLHLALGVERVEVHHDAADPQDRKVADDVIGRVGQAQAHPCALGNAKVLQAARGAARELANLGVTPAPPHEVDRWPRAVELHRMVQQVGQQPRRDRRHVLARKWRGLGCLAQAFDLCRGRHQNDTRAPSESTSADASCKVPSTRIGVCTTVPAYAAVVRSIGASLNAM